MFVRQSCCARDPAIDGKDYLLPASELKAVLIVARQKIVTLAPRVYQGIYRVHVITATKVKAYYGDVADEYVGGWIQLERVKGTWRVTDRSADVEHVKVTLRTNGSNQAMQRTAGRSAF